jgi:DNA modification methylase
MGASQDLEGIPAESIHLVVTSPPYPMISMWDEVFSRQNPQIGAALRDLQGKQAYELMHTELDQVWSRLDSLLVPGGIVCINIGDATRTLGQEFGLYPNHARIIQSFLARGFVNLPNILWRKPTNAPTKYMGSGMLPPGAYVTLEHEWILIFRKGGKRAFPEEKDRINRQRSAYFWEERNSWFSDCWDLKGIRQNWGVREARDRSAAFPFILPYRLIQMFSISGDRVMDPFLGTATTSLAAMVSERNSIGVEVEERLRSLIRERIGLPDLEEAGRLIDDRIDQHRQFVADYSARGKEFKHYNAKLNLPVMTSQEKQLDFSFLTNVHEISEMEFEASHADRENWIRETGRSSSASLGFFPSPKEAKSNLIEDISASDQKPANC